MPSHRLSDDRLIRQAVHTEDLYAKPSSGPGGSRTRVQTRIPRSSTIIVSSFVFLRKPFPPNSGN